MAPSSSVSNSFATASLAIVHAATWSCAALILTLLLFSSIQENTRNYQSIRGSQSLVSRPCDEIYIVEEGETLHTISDKCGDPFIVEQNPHIHDSDDVFPGLVIKITPQPKHYSH